jgi:SEC-C motif domain protein
MLPCPCGSTRSYEDCCGRLHAGAVAGTAEQLMRARYSAYVLGVHDYLLATWHPSTRPPAPSLDDGGRTRWLGLTVKRHAQPAPDEAIVEFVARYRIDGASALRLHEASRFLREDARWYYVDGTFPDA